VSVFLGLNNGKNSGEGKDETPRDIVAESEPFPVESVFSNDFPSQECDGRQNPENKVVFLEHFVVRQANLVVVEKRHSNKNPKKVFTQICHVVAVVVREPVR